MMSDVKIIIQIAVIPTLGSYGGNDRTRHSGSGEVGIAPGLGPGDRGFESRLPDYFYKIMIEIDVETIKKVRELRDTKQYTQAQISKICGVSLSTVKRILSKSYDKILERREIKRKKDEEFEKLVLDYLPKSNSLNHLCVFLGLKGVDGYYMKIRKIIDKYNLSTEHFGTLNVKYSVKYGRNSYTALSDKEFFINGSKRNSNGILKRLINHGIKSYECECCGISEWNGKELKLQIHHINGNHFDNRLENLQILCPNCHTQTDTYGSKNKLNKKINMED